MALFLIVATTSPAFAQNDSPLLELLERGRYAELDARLADQQRGYEEGTVDELDLLDTFRAFYVTDGALDARYGEWIARFPRSYVARLARGIYYKRIGMDLRGDAPAAKTASGQSDAMASYFEKAMMDFEVSLELDPKPLLSHLYMMDIEKHASPVSIRLWLFRLKLSDPGRYAFEQAIRVAPDSFILHRKYMLMLQTRWGGSVAAMAEFLEQCKQARLSTDHLKALEAMVVADRAWVKFHAEDYRGALDDHRRVRSLVDLSNPRLFEYGSRALLLQEMAYVHQALKQYAEALQELDQAIAAGADGNEVYYSRGISLWHLGRKREALEDYLKAAERGNAWAQNEVGIHYWHGIIFEQDREKALEWFRRSSEQGYADGVKHFRYAAKVLHAAAR
jgi:tetratricopeptide (TPR) repeat protein